MPYTADRVKNRRKKLKNKNRKKDISQPAPVNPCLYLEDTDSEYFSASEEFGERKVAGHGRCCPKAAGSESPARQKAIHDAQKVELFVRHLEQPDGWTDENGRRVPFYTFEFEGADLLPFVISRLPGFTEASIVLRIRVWPKPTADNPSPASYVQEFPELSNEEGRTTASLIIELERVNDNHYYPIVSGKPDHSLGGDGKCLFYSIWRALDRTADSSAKDLIYSGNVPKDKETGAARLRGMVIAHLRENPSEFADFLAGGMKAPFGSNSAAACRPHRSNNRDPLQISAEPFNSEIPASVDTDKVRSRQPYCDFGEERFDFLSESFLNSAEGIDHIVPATLERAVGLVQEIPFALMEIAKAIVQFVGEAVSRQAIPAATKACLPHLQRYIPLATASPLLISLLDASHTRKRLRALLLFISIILPFVYPAWATYAIITRLLCTLDIAISDDNWRDRGLTLFLVAHYALQLPVSSEYAGRILASVDNEYGFLRNIDWIFTLEQKLATGDPGIAIALFSACAAYQLLLADKITRSSDGSKKRLTYVVDYLTSASRIGAEMEIAATAGSDRLARDFDDFVCRHLSTTGPEGERFFSGIKITANGDSVASICARAGSSGVNSDAATGNGLLAYALSRCEHFYSDQGLDTQLWAADSGIPADLLAAMATCEAIRSFADERRDRNEATRAGATPGSLNVPCVAEPHQAGGRELEAIEAVIVREFSRITSPFVTAFPDKPRPINISSWVANADYSASLSASTKADEALRFQPGFPPTSMAQERAPLDASTATSAGEAVALLDQTANTLERLNAVLAAAAYLILSRRGGLTVVAAGVSLSTIIWAVIKARKGWRDERREHLPPQAAPFQNEQVPAQIDPGNKNLFEWVFHSWGEFSALETAITTVFDNGLFERTMLLMWTDGPAPLLDYQESIYGNAARIASADYSSDKKNSSAALLSSESRYGKELYQLLNSPVSSTVLPKIDKIVSLLIKVKTYETCRWRDLYGELKVGNIASAVKLEAIFSMRNIPNVIRPSEFELRKFMRSKLENTTATKIDEDCRQGCELALALYTSLVAENSGASAFSHEAILADAKNASSTIFSMISAGQDYLYNFRGTFCLPALKNKQKELLQYHYAAMYLPLLVADSQGFLDILVNLKNRFPKASSASASAMVLESRALAIDEAIWKFTSEKDKPKVRYLSTKELLDNYAGLVSSGEDVLYFISLVEAIFLWIKQGGRVEDLYREAGDPTKIIKRFRRAMELLPTSKAAHLRGIEGVSYLQNIKTSGETLTDIEYFSQFSFFKKTHLNSVSAFIAIDKLTQLWLSPYELVTLRPVRCIRLSLVFDMVFYSDPPALVRDHYRGGRTAVGELAFCQLESGSWILVAKIGNNLFLKKISHATMTGNPALNKINLEQPSTPFNPRIQLNHKEWQGAELEKLVFIPLFSNKFPPDKMTYQSPEMRMLFDDKKSGPQARLGSHPLLFEIVQDYAASLLGDALAQSKNEKYIKNWWQYITPMIPGFDITYHSYHDADYTPSFGEITWEVVNGAMLVTTLGIPAGELLYGEVGALRNSLLINAHQGFRGMALVSRVLSDVGTDVARASLRATTMAVSYFISPWEPVPLELIGMALYKGIRRLMRGKFVLKQKLPRDFVPAAPESGKGSDVKPPATNRTPQIFRTDFANEPKFYELNYEQEPEVLLGAGNDPHPGRSGVKQPDKLPGAPETSAWDGDPGTLENRGSINLREGPRTRTIQTPFQFSRSDLQFRSSGPVSSIHPIVDSGIHRLRLGQARDIVLSQFGQELPFSVDAARPGNNVDVLVLPPGNKGVTGILINFADILTDHPLIVSPGPISNSVFVMAVSEQNNIVVFYHLSEPHLDPLALGSHDPVIRRLFEVHNSLLEEFHTQLAIPDDVSMVDIHLLAGQFEYADIAYADPSEKAGFQDAAPGEPVFRKSALRSASRHMSSGGNSRIFNYALLGSDAQFSSAEGRIFYSLSRDTENRIRIRGRTEIAGELDDEFKITPAATAPQIETDEITEEIQALMRSDLQFSHFARIPTLLKPSDLKDLAKTFLPYKYETHFRLLKVWPPTGSASGTARMHILLVLHKNGCAYAVDIAATSFQDKGIASPIFESDNTWRVIYQTHLHDHVGVFQDFSDFKLFNSRFEAGLGSATAYDDVNDPSWEVLSRPSWLLSESNRMLVDAINVDREVAISTVEAGLSPEIPRISTPARSLQPFAIRWLNAVEDDSLNEAIKGAADIANMEVIEHHLMSYNIRTVIYTTLIYQKITDENPLLVFSIAAMDNKKVMYMIDPAARREGRYSSLFSWDDWVEYRSNGISISRKYRQAATVRKDFVFQNMNIGRIGTGNFFDETEWRYQVVSFDPSYHSEFSALIENVNGEADKSALKNGDLNFEKENEKLEKLHDKVIAESNDPIFPLIVTWIQQRRICEQLADFLSLKGLAGRLTDLQGRATGLQTQGSPKKVLAYDSVYMAGRKPDMLIRFALSYPFMHAQLKIKTYDPYKKIYISSDNFELTSVDSLDYLITREDLAYVLENYRNLYREIGRLALAYERDGGGPRAREIAANANAGFSTARHALEYSSSPLTHFFAAVDPSEKGKLGASVFGISVLRRNPGIHDSTVEVHSIIAHPFSQIRDDEGFIGYVFRHRHSDVWRRNILSKYRLAGIGHFLADHTIKYAATNIPGIKRIVADTINPRSRIIAAAYGMKKIDELAVYEEMVGPQYLLNARIYLSDLFRHGRFQTSPLSPGAGTSGAVSPAATDIELENLLVGRIAGATGKGVIYLKPDRANRNFPWLFKFARSDSEVKHDSPQSSAALDTLEPYNIQLGRGSDIVSYPKGSGVSYGDFWSGDNTQLDQLDVLQIPGGNNGANGIRISFAELVAGRPLLVSSGALAGSTQVVGIRTSEGAIYIYQAGKFTSASNWRTGVDGVKEIAHVHHVLTEGKSTLTLPDNPTNADLRGLSVFFDKIYIISNTPQTPGSLSRIDRTDAHRWVYNYQKKDNIFAIANSQFLILKNKQNEISIEGYVESGLIGDKPSKQIGMRASNQIERYFSKSVPPVSAEASRDLSYLTAKIMADPSLTYFFPLSRPDTAVAAKAVMLALRGAGRSVKCRVVLIWGVPDSIEPQVLHVIIDDTGKTPLAIDITAGRLAAYRFPFLGTEEIWARQTKKAFPRSFVAYQDFDSTDEIDKILLIGISDTDTAVGAMTALNVPEWHVQELDCSMYPYTATDTTNVKINLRINGKNEIDLDPKWKVDVSVQGLDYATNEGVFRGVYSKTERLRKKYFIKSKSNVYQVELNKNRSGWDLKISDLVEQPKTPIAVWRKDDGRWVTGESEAGVGLNPVAPSGGSFPHARAFDLLLGNLADIKINRALWHHDYDTRVVDRNAADISKYIDDEVRGWGTLKQYKDLFGFNPYDFLEPLSALSAINMFKLMVEERIAINPTMLQKTDFADFPAVLGSLDHQKNYVFLVNDARLLQSYLIDVPAGPETKAYILQSNSAQHVMPELKFKDWLTTRAKESISVQDILALMRGDFVHLSGREQRALLASIFDLHKNPDAVNLSRLRSDKGATFIMQAYDPASFLLNVQQLMDNNLKA